jgi:hypothetical protein
LAGNRRTITFTGLTVNRAKQDGELKSTGALAVDLINNCIFMIIYVNMYKCKHKGHDDDDVYFKKITMRVSQKCRPAKGMSKLGNIQIIKDKDIRE